MLMMFEIGSQNLVSSLRPDCEMEKLMIDPKGIMSNRMYIGAQPGAVPGNSGIEGCWVARIAVYHPPVHTFQEHNTLPDVHLGSTGILYNDVMDER